MGRYDSRIKVYSDGAWHTLSRIRVFANGAWQDLGTNDSSNNRQLYAKSGNGQVRITRNRVDTQKSETIGAGYHQGEWAIGTRQQYCFNNSGGATNTRFYASFKVKANAATRLFYFASAYFNNTWFEAGIRSNGKVWYRVKDGGGNGSWTPVDVVYETTAAIQMGFDAAWQTIEFIGEKGTNTLYVKVNGTSQGFPRRTAWESYSKDGRVGSNNLRVATDGSFRIDTANSPFTSISEDKTTRYYTETTWV